MTLATVLGCLIVGIILLVFSFSLLGSLLSSAEEQPIMPRSAVLYINFDQISITEQSTEDFDLSVTGLLSGSMGSSVTNLGIWQAIQAINAAATDPAVKFIYMKPDNVSGETAGIEEMRAALKKFRTSGKAIISYVENPGNASYYLASVSDKIYMASYAGGMNTLTGFATQLTYFKDILDKLGINVQLIRHGKYKSAGESYIRSSSSPENREQYQVMVDSFWKNWAEEMASARDLSLEQFNALIDGLKLNNPQDFLENGLVDELMDKEENKQKLCDLFGVEKYTDVKFISLADYAKLKVTANRKAKDAIAIIYANGQINDGNDPEEIAGDRFAKIIADVRQDSTIKAVVFRVNSPGGSVTASDKIKNEIDRLRECKPVVASYGSYAASGGYWISNSCDRIFSDANTLTGSIGVFSMIPDLSKTADKIGVGIETISSNKHGGMYSFMAPLDADETAYMQESVEEIYDTFTSIVASGRNLEQSYVDEIAQGRVWTGTDALKIGLVDEIGGIEAALNYAIRLTDGSSDLSSWKIAEYPAPQNTMEKLLGKFGQEALVFEGTPFESVERTFKDWDMSKAGEVYALLPYVLQFNL